MVKDTYNYSDFLYDLSKREIKLYSDLVKGLPKALEKVIDPENLIHFYGKDIFKEGDKELYFFYSDKIINVVIHERDIKFKTMKSKIMEANYIHPLNSSSPAELSLKLSDGEVIEFNSLKDSGSHWNEIYITSIVDIYKSI